MNISKNEDVFNDPYNPKWILDAENEDSEYNPKEVIFLSQRIKNYCRNNNGRKNYLEFCDNNSETLQDIKNFNPSFI